MFGGVTLTLIVCSADSSICIFRKVFSSVCAAICCCWGSTHSDEQHRDLKAFIRDNAPAKLAIREIITVIRMPIVTDSITTLYKLVVLLLLLARGVSHI